MSDTPEEHLRFRLEMLCTNALAREGEASEWLALADQTERLAGQGAEAAEALVDLFLRAQRRDVDTTRDEFVRASATCADPALKPPLSLATEWSIAVEAALRCLGARATEAIQRAFRAAPYASPERRWLLDYLERTGNPAAGALLATLDPAEISEMERVVGALMREAFGIPEDA